MNRIKNRVLGSVAVIMLLTLGACSTAGKPDHHHHQAEYEGACAYSMAHGKHLPGKSDLQVTYKGKTYFFSEENMRDHFLEEIKNNVDAANRKWTQIREGAGSHR